MKNLLFLIFLICTATTANATISMLGKVHYTNNVDDHASLLTYCPSSSCNISTADTWLHLKGKSTGGYAMSAVSGCSGNCTYCAAEDTNQCFFCAKDYVLAVSDDSTVCKFCMTNSSCSQIENVLSCSKNSNGCYVPTCLAGYYSAGKMTTKNGKVELAGYSCSRGIAHCIIHQGPTTCKACEDGYTLENNTCQENTNDTGGTTATDTLEGDCPSGLTRSSDGCCCLK